MSPRPHAHRRAWWRPFESRISAHLRCNSKGKIPAWIQIFEFAKMFSKNFNFIAKSSNINVSPWVKNKNYLKGGLSEPLFLFDWQSLRKWQLLFLIDSYPVVIFVAHGSAMLPWSDFSLILYFSIYFLFCKKWPDDRTVENN